MIFENIIRKLEEEPSKDTFVLKQGNIPVLLTAVHTVSQVKDNGQIKLSEPYTKAIAKYVADFSGASYLIKEKATGVDSNSPTIDEFKKRLLTYIEENAIKLVIDIHGASEERDFAIEFGTLNNLSTDYTVVKELEDAFKEQGITDIKYNDPFKGGGITQSVFAHTNIDVIQIEINRKYRRIENPENIEKVCTALINFISQLSMYTVL